MAGIVSEDFDIDKLKAFARDYEEDVEFRMWENHAECRIVAAIETLTILIIIERRTRLMKKKMIPLLLFLPLLFLLAVYGKDSNTAEIIKDGINGFLSDNEVTAFANRLRYILERPIIISMAAKGAAETLVRSWNGIAVEVLDRYQHLIDRQQNRLAI